jgi:DNA end-binding protein Ku
MSARAMWKGVLRVADARVPVKLYSAVEERDIRFRLLDAKDLTPVTQSLVHPESEEVVPHEETRRGYRSPEGELIVLNADELESLEPEASREIAIVRFLPRGAIDPQWYDRPYFLGPDRSPGAYHALTTAIERGEVEGIARWVMRKRDYVGALGVNAGHLVLVTLRHAGEVVPVESLEAPSGPKLDDKELEMARQLMQMLEAKFEAEEYRDEYRDRVLAFIEAKRRGKKPKLEVVRQKARTDDLTAALTASLRAHQRGKRDGRKRKEKARAAS